MKTLKVNMRRYVSMLSFSIVFVHLSAQDWRYYEVLSKVFEVVHETSKKEKFKGQILKDRRNGMGALSMKDGSYYIGDFYRDEIHGLGMYLAPENGYVQDCDSCVVYIGNWRDGKKNGMGTCYARNGDVIYRGNFENDKPMGEYPSTGDYTSRYFSLFDFGKEDMVLGEVKNGMLNGMGVIVFENGDLWIGTFRNGVRRGVSLHMLYNGEWETVNITDTDFQVLSSSESYRSFEAARLEARRQNLQEVMGLISQATESIAQIAGTVSQIKQGSNSTYSSSHAGRSDIALSSGSGVGNASRSRSRSNGGNTRPECGQAWRTDSRAYSNYDSQLADMQTWPERYDNLISDRQRIQGKMRSIRQKWEARGCPITKSSREN